MMLLMQMLSGTLSCGWDQTNAPSEVVRSAFEVRISDLNASAAGLCFEDNPTTREISGGKASVLPYTLDYWGPDDSVTEKKGQLFWRLWPDLAKWFSNDKCSDVFVPADDDRVEKTLAALQEEQIADLPAGLLITSGARLILNQKLAESGETAWEPSEIFRDITQCYDRVLVAAATERVFRRAVLTFDATDYSIEYQKYISGEGELEVYIHKVAPRFPNSRADCYDALHETWSLKLTEGVERQIRSFDIVSNPKRNGETAPAGEESKSTRRCGRRGCFG